MAANNDHIIEITVPLSLVRHLEKEAKSRDIPLDDHINNIVRESLFDYEYHLTDNA